MSCNNCQQSDCNQCGTRTAHPVWRPLTTVARACELVHALLKSQDCGTSCPDWELCKLIRFECELSGGRFNIATLAMLAAARMLESEALIMARRGNIKTLTISYNGNQSAQQLQEVAGRWRETAEKSAPRRSFGLIRTGQPCGSPSAMYNACGCGIKPSPLDLTTLTNCNWDCCEDCECQ